MITSPNSYFTAEEAKLRGAKPVVFFVLIPYYHPTGIALGSGTFLKASFVSPDRIQADYTPFADGYWYSPVLLADLGYYPSPVTFTLVYNTPGYDMTLKYRSAPTLVQLSAAPWQTVSPDEVLDLYRYYQWGVWWAGVRCWINDGEPEDDYTAWAQDEGVSDEYDSYAEDSEIRHDSQAYVCAVLFTGEYPIPLGHVIDPGQLTVESALKFEDIIAGDHSLVLANSQKAANGQPAPRFSPHKSSFLFAGETDWFSRKIRIEAGYVRPGTRDQVFDLITLYLGQIYKWGPLPRAVATLPTVEIYSKDWVAEALKRKIALPDSEGNPQPLFHGEYLAKAEEVSGKPLETPRRIIGFEGGNFEELDHTVSSGGGALSINSASPLTGSYSLRALINDASQSAYGQITLTVAQNEFFARFPWRWATMPGSPANDNLTCWQVLNAADGEIARFFVGDTGKLNVYAAGTSQETDWSIATHEGIRADVGLWVKTGNPGNISLWVGGDQVLEWKDVDLSGMQVKSFIFGLVQGAVAESWTVDIDNIRVYYSYLPNAFQVSGFPFTEIKSVYVDKQVYTAADMTKLPEVGAVSFAKVDDEGKPEKVSGEVMLRLVKDTISHPADVIESILAQIGMDSYIDAVTFTAAKAARPDDQIGVRLEEITAGEAIIEITSRCLYNFWVDQGVIKIKAYDGSPPASAVLSLNANELREIEPVWDMEEARNGVTVKWGWYDRNPDLFYAAGDISTGESEELDLTWNSPVASESETMAKILADLLLKRLQYGQEVMDSVKSSWRSLRVELGDGVEVEEGLLYDAALIYETVQKVVSLGPPYAVDLRLARFLGE